SPSTAAGSRADSQGVCLADAVPHDALRMAAPSNAAGFRKGLTSYGDPAFSAFLRAAFIKGAGFSDDALSRPIVGIANTGSGYNPCHGNAADLIAAVRRGVMLAGGLPIEVPTSSIHE